MPTDPGTSWSFSGAHAGWTITAGMLSYGPADLATGSTSAHVVSTTTSATCGTVSNTADVTASNSVFTTPTAANSYTLSLHDALPISSITITKTADAASVNAGE